MAKRHNPSKVSQRVGGEGHLGFEGRPNIFVEAVGSEVWGTQLPYLRTAARNLIGTDSSPLAFGLYQVDGGFLLPACPVDNYVSRAIEICRANRVNVVIPCLGSALLEWARHRERLAAEGIHVLISPPATVAMCCDKWEMYRFFLANGIPTPRTSLQHVFELIKLRAGEGVAGVLRVRPEENMQIDMTGCISQEFLNGDEYSIDVLCDLRGDPIYIVPRQRCLVRSGRSVVGKVVDDVEIVSLVRRIVAEARFLGPVNVQCFRTEGGLFFTDLNPRVSGGLTLSFAATENWFRLIPRLLLGKRICPKPVVHGLVMMRYLTEMVIDQGRIML